MDDKPPPDPDLDDLPDELREHPGPLIYGFVDAETGDVHAQREVTKTEVATMLADERRAREAENE